MIDVRVVRKIEGLADVNGEVTPVWEIVLAPLPGLPPRTLNLAEAVSFVTFSAEEADRYLVGDVIALKVYAAPVVPKVLIAGVN